MCARVLVCVFNLLRIDDLEPLLHLAALVPPALLISDQRDVRMVNTVITVTAVHTLTVLIVTKIIITEPHTTQHLIDLATEQQHSMGYLILVNLTSTDQVKMTHESSV